MPVILKIENPDGQRTGVWEVKEDEDTLLKFASLSEPDFNIFSGIANPGRRIEWLGVRALLKEFYSNAPSISYHENGKPHLINHHDKISISHSGKMVAIALHPTRNPGIDIELIHPRIFKIASRFLNEFEKAYLGAQPSTEQLFVIWGAKEVMFKVYEHGNVSFKNNFRVNPFTLSPKASLEGIIDISGTKLTIPMEYRKMGEYVLVGTKYA